MTAKIDQLTMEVFYELRWLVAVIKQRINPAMHRVILDCSSDADGSVRHFLQFRGLLDRVIVLPGANDAQPSANFDLYLRDRLGNDVLETQLENLSNSAASSTRTYRASGASDRHQEVCMCRELDLQLDNAGEDKRVRVMLEILEKV